MGSGTHDVDFDILCTEAALSLLLLLAFLLELVLLPTSAYWELLINKAPPPQQGRPPQINLSGLGLATQHSF